MGKLYNATTALVSSTLALVNPAAAARYRGDRNRYRAYTAGMKKDGDHNFAPRLRTADADIKRAWPLVTARCRDQVENNPLISGAIERISQNVVRNGINPKFHFKQNGKTNLQQVQEWAAAFTRWSRYCELSGHDDWASTQRLILRHMWSDGGCLVHRVYDDSLPGVCPLRLELIELDQLDPLVDGTLANGNIARRGIEYNQQTGRPIAYHLLPTHPGDYLVRRRGNTRRIPAADIIHIWDRRRISQYSGIPWLVAVVMEAYRMEDFRHITQDAARLQTIFGAFLKSSFPGIQLGAGMALGGQAGPVKPGFTGADGAPTEIGNGPMIQKLPTGTDLQFTPTAHPGSNYEPFVKDSQRWQSTGLGMSFEAFANNYTDSSYASARSGALEERLGYRGQQQFLDRTFCRKVYAWFIEAQVLSGLARLPGYFADPLLFAEAVSSSFPGWAWVDPQNDAAASEKLLSLSLTTHRHLAAQRGEDFDDNIEILKEEYEKIREVEELKAKVAALKSAQEKTP